MRAESLNALVVSGDDQFCAYVNDCLRWAGAERIGRVRSGSSAQAILNKKRFVYSIVVIQIVEDEAFDVRFIESLLSGTNISLRFIPIVAIATVQSKSFYRELSGLGFSALVLSPVRRSLLRNVFVQLFQKLQNEFRNPDEGMLAKALVAGDLDYIEERCARALHHNPSEPLYTSILGEATARRQNWVDALKYADHALTKGSEPGLPEATRLKAKALFHLGREEEAFALLPQILKATRGSGPNGSFLVLGMVPLLNRYARQLKSITKIEEALLYYNKALDEPDSSSVTHQILLNMALARFSEGSFRDSYELAKRAASTCPQQFHKAEQLVHLLETEYKNELRSKDAGDDGSEFLDFSDTFPEESTDEDQNRKTPAARLDINALDDDLTEEVDFPHLDAGEPSQPSEKSSILEAVISLGTDTGLDGEESTATDLDAIGDSLDLDMDGDLDEMDFSVSTDQLEELRLQKEKQTERPDAYPSESPEDATTIDPTDLDLSDLSDSLIAEALNQSGEADNETTLNEPDFGDGLGDIPGQDGGFPAGDDDLMKLLSETSKEESDSDSSFTPNSDDDTLSMLLSAQDHPTASPEQTNIDSDLQDRDPAPTQSESEDETQETDATTDDGHSPSGVKWDSLPDEEIEKYIMYEREFPRIKVKPCPIRPRAK